MTNSNKKDKAQKPKILISRRETTGKKKPDLFAKFRNNEHPLDNIIPKITEQNTEPTPPTPPTKPTPPTAATQATPPTLKPISPEKDFGKVANSIIRDAMAQGLFIGKSKQIYDYLYFQTRAAIQPKRSIRITKGNLMRGSDIGSERTLLKNIAHLKAAGLLKVTEFDGQHGGNDYEVFLPEETQATPPTPPTARQSPYPLQKVGTLPPVESGVGGVAEMPVNIEQNESLRLSFKDYKNDDEAFAVLNEACREVTGRDLTEKDYQTITTEIFGILADEMRRVRGRTKSISSFSGVLTTHLKSVFADKPKIKVETFKDTVGKFERENMDLEPFIPEPLTDEQRTVNLASFKQFAETNPQMLLDMKANYLADDWNWLVAEIKDWQKVNSKIINLSFLDEAGE